MAKYLMLKHYRGGRPAANPVPMDQLAPEEWSAHIQYMHDMEQRLIATGELVSSEGLSMGGAWVRFDGEGRPPVVDGPFAETKDLIAGWMMIDVDSYERALELASELSAAPWAGGAPLGEWLELREVMSAAPADA
ncbi:YciI family protein [Microbacter sp. GSS18]|nr:YciI family protein [Microbacter sp. GSS18]